MNVVIDHAGELYSLLVDQVGDVLSISGNAIEPLPQTLISGWRAISDGVVKLKDELVLVLVPDALLRMVVSTAMAGAAA